MGSRPDLTLRKVNGQTKEGKSYYNRNPMRPIYVLLKECKRSVFLWKKEKVGANWISTETVRSDTM